MCVVGGTAVLPAGLAMEEVIDRYRVTATLMPPAGLRQLLETHADLRSLGGGASRWITGEPQPDPRGDRPARSDRVAGVRAGEAGVIAMLTPDDVVSGHEASVGRPLPAVKVAVREGEIHVRSPRQMIGYWNDPEQTRDVLNDGWIRTRDLGYVDEQGYLHLTGLAPDVIMVNAEVCYAGAIERFVAEHPAVAQAYAVGALDPETGEATHAFVVPIDDEPPDVDELTDLVRRRLSRNSVPSSITVTRDIPLSASGTPDKYALIAGIR